MKTRRGDDRLRRERVVYIRTPVVIGREDPERLHHSTATRERQLPNGGLQLTVPHDHMTIYSALPRPDRVCYNRGVNRPAG
jgi:hypothetical protein